jgi:flagellar hook-basal body complex protein FliE
MIEAIGNIAAAGGLHASAAGGGHAVTNQAGFEGVFQQALDAVNGDMLKAEGALQQLASGQPVEIHDVMIALEKARIGVQTVIQVRNRMVEAYQELMRMQI